MADLSLQQAGPAVGVKLRIALWVLLIGVGILIGSFRVNETGFLWADAPRYTNGAAMIHDWFGSGELKHPYEFAKQYYIRFPGFSIPFHPPVYPGLMAIFFSVFGVSYVSARIFIGLCLGLAGCFFARILAQLGASYRMAWCFALLLVTMPDVAYWSRTTMSEVPSLMLILLATSLFLSWLQTSSPWRCWAAFAVAEMAFLSRLATAGVLPIWFLFALVTRRWKQIFSPHTIACSVLYLAVNAGWVKFVKQFSRFETGPEGLSKFPPDTLPNNLLYYASRLHDVVGWPTLILAILGVVTVLWLLNTRRDAELGIFWLCWCVGYVTFLLAQSLYVHNEQRYIFAAIPGIAGLAACALSRGRRMRFRQVVVGLLFGLCLLNNAWAMRQIPRGVVGYQEVARCVVSADQPGNILTACPRDQDFIFRYRAENDDQQRQVIRSDRVLAVRPPDYVDVDTKILAFNAEHVLDVVRKGRIRYLITSSPNDPELDERYQEMKLAHDVASSQPAMFRRVQKIPMLVELGRPGRFIDLFVWEYLGELPSGPSELPVVIPTAAMQLFPDQNKTGP